MMGIKRTTILVILLTASVFEVFFLIEGPARTSLWGTMFKKERSTEECVIRFSGTEGSSETGNPAVTKFNQTTTITDDRQFNKTIITTTVNQTNAAGNGKVVAKNNTRLTVDEGRFKRYSNYNSTALADETIVDIHTQQYKFLANEPDLCRDGNGQSEPVYLLILMISRTGNGRKRRLQRNTGLSLAKKINITIKTVFIMGRMENVKIHSRIIAESKEYRDLVFQDYIDSYRNLTIKTMMALRWAAQFCPQATWVMKVDDDVYLNLNHIIHELRMMKRARNMIIGRIMFHKPPIRDKKSKWYISEVAYPGKYYPDYLSGICYIISGDLPSLLVEESLKVPYLFLEDVYVGILSERLNIRLQDNRGRFEELEQGSWSCLLRNKAAVHLSAGRLKKYWSQQMKYLAGNIMC